MVALSNLDKEVNYQFTGKFSTETSSLPADPARMPLKDRRRKRNLTKSRIFCRIITDSTLNHPSIMIKKSNPTF